MTFPCCIKGITALPKQGSDYALNIPQVLPYFPRLNNMTQNCTPHMILLFLKQGILTDFHLRILFIPMVYLILVYILLFCSI